MMFGQYPRREADEATERIAGDDGERRGWSQHRSWFLASTVNLIGVREAPVPKPNKSMPNGFTFKENQSCVMLPLAPSYQL